MNNEAASTCKHYYMPDNYVVFETCTKCQDIRFPAWTKEKWHLEFERKKAREYVRNYFGL